ncbi:MAG: DEAD/DEAH box helicase [Clostridiales bacterium]|nr:DEAD/DEAH box helicase [Clostridiales bacterium]
MTIVELLKETTRIINKSELTITEQNILKDLLCYLSEWRKNNIDHANQYPQLEFILYNASRKLRTFGYNRLNKFDNEVINADNTLAVIRDKAVDELYKTESGFFLDKAQKEVLEVFENANERLFLSAPTSFGKTFLLKEIIYRHHEKYQNIVIVLPTVALLIEVTEEIDAFNAKYKFGYSIYNSVYKDLELSERNIFVLTPERVVRLLAIVPDIEINFFFFDEIYKIDEDVALTSEDDISEKIQLGNNEAKHDDRDDRAVAFRLALYFLLKKSRAVYLAGPFIEISSLREGFVRMLETHDISAKEITFNPTLKNEIDFHGKTLKYFSPFEKYEEKTPADTSIKKLIYTAQKLKFSKTNQAIVYCLYPGYTEQYAREFSNKYKEQSLIDERIQMFIEHLKNNYSFSFGGKKSSFDNWDFVYALRNQVGIHNGKFPKYFQREIMRLFNDGAMSTLFCTSTIVEGVNTNAKTVVVYNNPSGNTNEGKRFLLLNINGRAGRYQHHFIGNIVYLSDKSLKIVNSNGIALDFKPYNSKVCLSDLDLENIADDDLSQVNRERKAALNFNKQLLPDDVFEQNRLIERKKQEEILLKILDKVDNFIGVESASVYDFVSGSYFETILQIWSEIGEIKSTQIKAIKMFSINYAKNSYRGVLDYRFKKYSVQETDEHKFVNDTYRKVFYDVKDTIEYQLPRIISLFESLIIRAFEIKRIKPAYPIDLSNIIRFFEIGATTPLGIDMVEKAIPIVTVKKVDQLRLRSSDLDGQRNEFAKLFNRLSFKFDGYEKHYLVEYITKYCQK